MLHLKRWGNHLHSYKISSSENSEFHFPEFAQHHQILTLEQAFQVVQGKSMFLVNLRTIVDILDQRQCCLPFYQVYIITFMQAKWLSKTQ